MCGAIGIAGVLPAGSERGHDSSDEGDGGDQSQLLMNFEHVSAFIEQRLFLGVALRLLRGEAEIGERGLGLAAGGSVGQIAFGLLLGQWRENEVQGLRSAGDEGEFGGLRFEAVGGDGDFVGPA